jgi:triosephosphate isomerase
MRRILCVGETAEECHAGLAEAKVRRRVGDQSTGSVESAVIADGSLRAIGTGGTVASDDARATLDSP